MADDNLKAAMDLIRGKAELIADGFRSDPRITEIGKLLHSLNTLEELSGEPLTTMGAVLKFSMDESGNSSPAGATTRPDEYYGLEPLEAAKRVLKKIGRSAGISEIMAGIKAGGGETGSQGSLQLSLARSTMEIAKITDGVFGLLEFYPHIKRGKPGRRKKGEPDMPNGAVATATPDAVANGVASAEDEEEDQGSQ